jgi:hypothetical protein
MYPHIIAKQRLCKTVTAATNTLVTIFGHVGFYLRTVVSNESRQFVLPTHYIRFRLYEVRLNICLLISFVA